MNSGAEALSQYAEQEYNTAAIRELMTKAFSDEELISFCFDHFLGTYEKFCTGMSRVMKIHYLIEDSYRQGRLEELLSLLKKYRPMHYEQFGATIYQLEKGKNVSNSASKGTVAYVVLPNIDLVGLTMEQKDALELAVKVSLAIALRLSVNEVKIMNMEPGSVNVKVNLPEESIEQLLKLSKADLAELGIEMPLNERARLVKVLLPDIWIDEDKKEVWIEGQRIGVPPNGFSVLLYLYRHKNQVCSYEDIIEQALKEPYNKYYRYDERARLHNIIHRLRKDIEPDPSNPKYVKYERGVGYKLVLP
jgi:DNA-binding winged helix-turn-helix (wHTH) protein